MFRQTEGCETYALDVEHMQNDLAAAMSDVKQVMSTMVDGDDKRRLSDAMYWMSKYASL